MIAPNISVKLEGRHYEAFRAFALRSCAVTSTDNLKRLIETLPEFQSLLNIHENANSSGELTHLNKDESPSQEDSAKLSEE